MPPFTNSLPPLHAVLLSELAFLMSISIMGNISDDKKCRNAYTRDKIDRAGRLIDSTRTPGYLLGYMPLVFIRLTVNGRERI